MPQDAAREESLTLGALFLETSAKTGGPARFDTDGRRGGGGAVSHFLTQLGSGLGWIQSEGISFLMCSRYSWVGAEGFGTSLHVRQVPATPSGSLEDCEIADRFGKGRCPKHPNTLKAQLTLHTAGRRQRGRALPGVLLPSVGLRTP